MEKATQFLVLLSTIILLLLLLPLPVQPADPCEPESCHPTRGPVVRFPFRLRPLQPSRCGYPGFNLRCNSRNQTILNLPRSGEFVVHHINYKASALYIGDPGFCLPARALNFSLSGSVFDATHLTRFGILNCTDGLTDDDGMQIESYNIVLPCLSTRNNTVMAVDVDLPAAMVPPPCRRMNNMSVPPLTYSEFSWGSMGTGEDFELRWGRPGCGRCESRGGRCGFKEDWGFEVKCYGPSGLPRGAKYAIIIGGGILGLLCVIGLIGYAYKKMEIDRQRRLSNEPPTSFFDRQLVARATTGLDRTTIESYPKTELGQSRRLPNPSDNTCSICLCDYQPKETLKTIPECNHYFHATCIDEWLKLNSTCPLCRNSPETSSATSASSSSSSPSPTASDRN